MTANRSMALRVVWSTRLDDDTPADDARELMEMLGLVERGGREVLPDEPPRGRLLDERGRPISTAPPRLVKAAPAPKKGRGGGPGRKTIPIEHGTEHGYLQHKRKGTPIPDDDSCGCQAAHDAQLKRPARKATAEPVSAPPPPPEPVPDTTPLDEWPEPAPPVVTGPAPLGEVTSSRDLNDWLAAAQRSPRPTIRRQASAALVALLQLHIALDDLARAERAEGHAR